MQFLGATAQFNNIPDVELPYNNFKSINLNNYCHSTQSNNFCKDTSYQVSFINPDNNNQVTFLQSGENSNSYFIISLSNGLISIASKTKNLDLLIEVRGADTEYSSQTQTLFFLRIAQTQTPEQIATLSPVVLYGNQTKTFILGQYFLYESYFTIAYEDSNLSQSIFLNPAQYQNQSLCSDGILKVCLSSGSILKLVGKGNNYNGTITITAINGNGNLNYKLLVTTYPATLEQYTTFYNQAPYRKPLSIAPVNLDTGNNTIGVLRSTYFSLYPSAKYLGYVGDEYYFDFDNFYGNYTSLFARTTINVVNDDYAIAPNSTNLTLTLWENLTAGNWYSYVCSNYTGGSTSCVLRGLNNGVVNYTSTYPFGTWLGTDYNTTANYGVMSMVFGFYSQWYRTFIYENGFSFTGDFYLENPNLLYFSSYLLERNYQFYIGACNSIGCTSSDDFGNEDILFVNISDTPPTPVDITISPLILGYSETKSRDMNLFFNNFDYIVVNWSEGIQDFSLKTPANSFNSTTYTTGGDLIYQVKLYSSNILSVTSATNNHNFTMNIYACNSIGCIHKNSVAQNITLNTIIQDTSQNQIQSYQIESSSWKSSFNYFFTLFPDKEDITQRQKSTIFAITLFLVVGMVLFFGFKSSSSIMPLMYISGVLGFFLFIFFIFKGYVGVTTLVVLLLVAVLVLYLKLGGKE